MIGAISMKANGMQINTVAMKEKIIDILERHYFGRNQIESRCADELLDLFGVIETLSMQELKDILCNTAQLIAGWNATESEWTDWDSQVYKKITDLQIKLDKLSEVNFR